ncbi:MAG: hypothetical protein ACLU9S_23080 [Oscillospiraceae bacterium]
MWPQTAVQTRSPDAVGEAAGLQDYSPLAEAMAQRLDDFALGLHVSADGADLIAGVARLLGAGGCLGVYQDVAVAQAFCMCPLM